MKVAVDAAVARLGGLQSSTCRPSLGKSASAAPRLPCLKGAVRLMSKNDAITYAPEKIRVNSIHPAYIWTPIVEKQHLRATSPDFEAAKAAGAAHPIGAMGEPDNIVGAVVWLDSDEAKFAVAEIVIDGGNTAR